MLNYIYNKKFPKPNEYFSYCCPITKIPFNYNYPTKYDLLLKILTEQSIIFISEDLQNLTAMV